MRPINASDADNATRARTELGRRPARAASPSVSRKASPVLLANKTTSWVNRKSTRPRHGTRPGSNCFSSIRQVSRRSRTLTGGQRPLLIPRSKVRILHGPSASLSARENGLVMRVRRAGEAVHVRGVPPPVPHGNSSLQTKPHLPDTPSALIDRDLVAGAADVGRVMGGLSRRGRIGGGRRSPRARCCTFPRPCRTRRRHSRRRSTSPSSSAPAGLAGWIGRYLRRT
jgi:hypothetical protein